VKPGVISLERRRLQVPIDLELALAPVMGTSLALDRRVAARERLPLARAGHPQLDALAKHLLTSDRGVTFAVFRPVRGEWPPRVVLRTDFLLTAHCDPDLERVADRLGIASWLHQLVQECRPPTVVSIAMDPEGQPVSGAELQRVYERRAGDLNLTSRPDLFRRITQHIDWEDMCVSALPLARALLNKDTAVNEQAAVGAVNLRRRITQRADRRRARRASGNLHEGGSSLEPLLAAIPDRIDVFVETLGCGAVLSGDPSSIGRTA
jgi:ATP-dependent helicase HepA